MKWPSAKEGHQDGRVPGVLLVLFVGAPSLRRHSVQARNARVPSDEKVHTNGANNCKGKSQHKKL